MVINSAIDLSSGTNKGHVMTRWPARIDVASKVYVVKYQAAPVGNAWGQCDFSARTIVICTHHHGVRRQPADIFETLWHEVKHAILHEHQLMNAMLIAGAKDGAEEPFIDELCVVESDVLIRNGIVSLPKGGGRQ